MREDMTTMGSSFSVGSWRTRPISSKPSMRGISRSVMRASKRRSPSISQASQPSSAVSAWNPEAISTRAVPSRASRESSATSMRGGVRRVGASGVPRRGVGRLGQRAGIEHQLGLARARDGDPGVQRQQPEHRSQRLHHDGARADHLVAGDDEAALAIADVQGGRARAGRALHPQQRLQPQHRDVRGPLGPGRHPGLARAVLAPAARPAPAAAPAPRGRPAAHTPGRPP